MGPAADDAFLDEVARLFAREAREWLDQIKAAMPALESTAAATRVAAAATLQRALTNLGGSAATVEQPTIEQAAFSLLPLLPALKGGPAAASTALARLREGLTSLDAAVRRLAGEEPTDAEAAQPVRVTPVELRQLDRWAGERQRLLSRLDAGLPAAERILQRLMEGGDGGGRLGEEVSATVEDLASLQAEAESVGATDVATLLRGLGLVLRVTAGGKVRVTPHQVRAVRTRVAALRPMAEAWCRREP